MSEPEAKEALSERQCTFSLEKCIQKFGEEEGLKRFKERQEKWLNSLNTPENKEKIQQGRINSFLASQKGYSKIALNLFKNLYKQIDLTKFSVFYKDPEQNKREYFVHTRLGVKFLDFYIKELNFAIEFDGSYWHKDKEEADKLRDELIKEQLQNIQIIHIKEEDYKKDKEKITLFLVRKILETMEKNNGIDI